MELSTSRDVSIYSNTQEIHSVLRNRNVHYRVHKSSLLVPILNQMNPVGCFPYVYNAQRIICLCFYDTLIIINNHDVSPVSLSFWVAHPAAGKPCNPYILYNFIINIFVEKRGIFTVQLLTFWTLFIAPLFI
jgi:hypothetical protein